MPWFSYPSGAAAQTRLEKVTILHPSSGSEGVGTAQKLTWADGTESLRFQPNHPSVAVREDALWATEYSYDPASRTFDAKRVPVDDDAVQQRRRLQANTVDNCGFTDTPCDSGFGGDSYTVGQFSTLIDRNDSTETTLTLGVMPCHGDREGFARVDQSDRSCSAWTSGNTIWSPGYCSNTALQIRGQISSSVYTEVTATYYGSLKVLFLPPISEPPFGTMQQHVLSMRADSTGEIYSGVNRAVRRVDGSFTGPRCGSIPSGGGTGSGPNPGDPSDPGDGGGTGGGSTYCVEVYDGLTDNYLGSCCGTTTDEIVSCAAGYL
ncbi:MAG TPA: hypothetical protein VFN10_02195 [Thermoanaerobaculia bacterium]|nr:hypothetical protein [Thermoanaerobaculia bacterium]